MINKLLISFLGALLFTSAANAGAVTGYYALDGFNTVPVAKGSYLIDFRFNGGIGLASNSSFSFAPTLNFAAGVWEGVEVGIGGGLNFSGFGTPTNNFSVESVYPWIRASLPLSNDLIKTGLIVGSLIPVYNSVTPAQPGISFLMDIATGPVTSGLNLGYSRTIPAGTSGDNILSGNINFTLPVGAFTLYEEQWINYPTLGNVNGGFRGTIFYPVLDNKITVDVNPSILYSTGPKGTDWTFSPNIGLTYTF
jgi:hypothetical protein